MDPNIAQLQAQLAELQLRLSAQETQAQRLLVLVTEWIPDPGAPSGVDSVNGRNGVVTLTSADVGLGNVPNTNATNRSSHSGTQLAATISDFATAAAAAAPVQSVAGKSGTVTLAPADVGLGNVTNVNAVPRANHTGTQLAATISDFSTAVYTWAATGIVGDGATITVTQDPGNGRYVISGASAALSAYEIYMNQQSYGTY
jgi:hypothetical protein